MRLALEYSPSDKSRHLSLIVALRHSGGAGEREEIQALVKRLSDLQQASRQQDLDRKKFKLVEQPGPEVSPGAATIAGTPPRIIGRCRPGTEPIKRLAESALGMEQGELGLAQGGGGVLAGFKPA